MAILLKRTLKKEDRCNSYAPGGGYFTIEIDNYWVYCREEFHSGFFGDNFFYKPKNNQNVKDIVKTISFYEKKLKLPLNKQIKVQQVKVKNLLNSEYDCLLIKVPRFWKDPVRYNLLTLIIRSAPEKIKETLPAINFFLKGNVYYQDAFFRGWIDSFQHADKITIKKLLGKKPSKEKELECLFNENFSECFVKKY